MVEAKKSRDQGVSVGCSDSFHVLGDSHKIPNDRVCACRLSTCGRRGVPEDHDNGLTAEAILAITSGPAGTDPTQASSCTRSALASKLEWSTTHPFDCFTCSISCISIGTGF